MKSSKDTTGYTKPTITTPTGNSSMKRATVGDSANKAAAGSTNSKADVGEVLPGLQESNPNRGAAGAWAKTRSTLQHLAGGFYPGRQRIVLASWQRTELGSQVATSDCAGADQRRSSLFKGSWREGNQPPSPSEPR